MVISDQCENDNISDDVIDGVINCTSVMRKCLFVNKSVYRGRCEYMTVYKESD